MVSCTNTSEESQMSSFNEVLNQQTIEISERVFDQSNHICFYMYYPSGSQRVQIKEYVTLSILDENVQGYGAGSSEGELDWSFNFEGRILQGNIMEVTVYYSQEGIIEFTTNETWILDLKNGALKLDFNIPTDLRILGDGKFHKIDCQLTEEWAQKLIHAAIMSKIGSSLSNSQ
jgi:hypothetical protein